MASEPERPFVPTPIRSGALGLTDPASDLAACRRILAQGSKSFAAASLLLPRRMRDPAAAFYAFCRIADDLVDFSPEPSAAVDELHARLDRIYAGAPIDDPVDRAFTRVVEQHGLPRVIVDALIDGFAWDAQGREYATLADLLGYCARVASAVGVVMTLFMGPRERRTLVRACDLGAAMQLTNIARDVLEDAGRGRVYLPSDALRERGIEPAAFVRSPGDHPRVAEVVRMLLDEADEYYLRADAGITLLPWDCRPAIRAASLIYADIGRVVRAQGCDPLRGRAYTGKPRKLALMVRAWVARTPELDRSRLDAPVIPECAFLVDAITA
ncbi:phytoene/squalene synthase family protein [Nannocystaceae bacterium ST9]